MKKKLFTFIIIVIIFIGFGCSDKADFGIKRTYLIYMNGSDLETNYGAASDDIKEIVTAKTGKKLSIYIYTGGTEKWHTEGISSLKNELFKVENNELVKIESFDNSNMGSSATLAEFVNYVYDKEGNCEYNIILWNHGGNALTGFGKDETHEQDSLLTEELKNAFNLIEEQNGIHFGFIAFDACLMANMETVTAIGKHTDYFVASEEVVPACGFDYKSFFEKQKEAMNPSDNAKLLAKLYFEKASSEYLSDYLSISVIDTDKTDEIRKKFENAVSVSDIGGEQIMMFGGRSKQEGYSDMADMVSIFREDSLKEVQELVDCVNDAVVYIRNGRNCFGACGISIYFPYYEQSDKNNELYAQNSFSELYSQKIGEYEGKDKAWNNKNISMEIEGLTYECEYCSSALFFDYYTAYISSEKNSTFTYRIRKNNISDEVKIDSVFVSVEGEYGKSEEKYLKYKDD